MLTVCTMTDGEVRSRDGRAEDLIGRMARGDMSAMEELYGLIQTDVYAYALSKTASKPDAEDVTHDTFVQIWKNAPRYQPMGKPMAWVFTVEMNLIRRHFQKTKRTVSLDEAFPPSAEEDFTEEVINREFLRQMLSTLSEEEREVITLHIVSGMKHREIAKLLQKPLSTVLSKYNRAIKKLQIEIQEKEEQK